MKVDAIGWENSAVRSVLTGEIACARAMPRVFPGFIAINSHVEPPDSLGDPFLAACLLPAMFIGEDLEIAAPVSLRLLAATDTVQDIFLAWFPGKFERIKVHAAVSRAAVAPSAARRAAVFFSGGVDSWFSLLKHRPEINALMTVKGFDIPLADRIVFPQLTAAAREVAAESGAIALAVETNLRDYLDPWPGHLGRDFGGDFWGPVLHGAMLGAVGLCLQRHYSRAIIPSSHAFHELFPWGSHPLVDRLWSTESMAFEHDGCEAIRTAKVAAIARHPEVLRHLRVCADYAPKSYNCGSCEKCVRTLLALHLHGVRGTVPAFGRTLDFARLETMAIAPGRERWYHELRAEAEAQNQADLIRVLRVMLGMQWSTRRQWSRLREQAGKFGASALRLSGLPRHARSIRKRWNRLRTKQPDQS